MKKTIILTALVGASVLNAQSFVAGWDFDGVNAAATTATANWGGQSSSATASWTHSPANPPSVWVSEFGIDAGFNSDSANSAFTFLDGGVDAGTGFTSFDGNGGTSYGFQSVTADDTFTLSFSGTGWTDIELKYAYSSTGSLADYSVVTVDLSHLDGVASASYDFTPTANGLYDNFAITAVVPEPSSFAAIAGVLALGFVAIRRRHQ